MFLTLGDARFAGPLAAAGLSPVVLPPPAAPRARPRFLVTPGFVIFTSGSTGAPRPTFRSTAGLLTAVAMIARTYALPAGASIAGCLPLATPFGLTQLLMLPALLGGRASLLEHFDYRSLLSLFAAESFDYWPGTALMADLLVGGPLGDWPGRAPATCNLSSRHLPVTLYRRSSSASACRSGRATAAPGAASSRPRRHRWRRSGPRRSAFHRLER